MHNKNPKGGRQKKRSAWRKLVRAVLCVALLVCVCTAGWLMGPKADWEMSPTVVSRPLRDYTERSPFVMPGFDQETLVESFLYNFGYSGDLLDTPPADPGQTKVACVGDSITYGYGVMDWSENNYPTVLQNRLGSKYNVQNFGVSGYCVQTTADKAYAGLKVYSSSVEYDADVLVFMMGSNDSKPQNWIDGETFKSALCQLLDSYGKTQVILCTPSYCHAQDMGKDSYGIQADVITEIAQIVREVAQERNYTLVDIYALTIQNPLWFEIDGVHPNVEGAAAIAGEIYETIKFLEHKAVRLQGVS